MAYCFLKQLYPKLLNNTCEPKGNYGYQSLLQSTIKSMKRMSPFPEERDANKVSSYLISILAMEDWNGQLQRARGCAAAKLEDQIEVYEQLSKEYSLIGGSSPAMALAAMKSALDGLVSVATAEGRASKETLWGPTTEADIHKLCKTGDACINALTDLLYKTSDRFEEMVATIQSLTKIATRVGTTKLERICEKFVEFCKKKDKKGCWKVLNQIQNECCEVGCPYDIILELQELIELVEETVGGQVFNNS